MLHCSRDNYWKELAEQCVDHGVGVGLILTPNCYIDAATLGMHIDPKPAVLPISLVGVVPGITGGDMYFLPRFNSERDVAVLCSYTSQIMRHETHLSLAMLERTSVKAYSSNSLERTAANVECGILGADTALLPVSWDINSQLDCIVITKSAVALLDTTIRARYVSPLGSANVPWSPRGTAWFSKTFSHDAAESRQSRAAICEHAGRGHEQWWYVVHRLWVSWLFSISPH